MRCDYIYTHTLLNIVNACLTLVNTWLVIYITITQLMNID